MVLVLQTKFFDFRRLKSFKTEKMAAPSHSCGDDNHNCHHSQTNPSLHQSLDELEFERGIWSAALAGDIEDVTKKLNRGDNVNKTDKSGYTALVSQMAGFRSRSRPRNEI